MLQIVVNFLIARLTPADLIVVGESLLTAGHAAQQKQALIADAIKAINVGVGSLTK
jgi:hypothetical protein